MDFLFSTNAQQLANSGRCDDVYKSAQHSHCHSSPDSSNECWLLNSPRWLPTQVPSQMAMATGLP